MLNRCCHAEAKAWVFPARTRAEAGETLGRKRRRKMLRVKNSKWLVSGLVLTGMLGLGGTKVIAASDVLSKAQSDGVLSKTQLTEGNYCHLQFPAIRPSTLGTDHPQLKSANTGDIVDFYGPCNHDPLGKDEVLSQEQESEFNWDHS